MPVEKALSQPRVEGITEANIEPPHELTPPRQGAVETLVDSTSRGKLAPLFTPKVDTIEPGFALQEAPELPASRRRERQIARNLNPERVAEEERRAVEIKALTDALKPSAEQEAELAARANIIYGANEQPPQKGRARLVRYGLVAAAALIVFFIYLLTPLKEPINTFVTALISYIRLGVTYLVARYR